MQDGQEGHWACGDQVADVQVEDVQERLLQRLMTVKWTRTTGVGLTRQCSARRRHQALGLVGSTWRARLGGFFGAVDSVRESSIAYA